MLINPKFLPLSAVRGVIHVGAHEAEELPFYVAAGISRIIWIEANPGKYNILMDKIKPYPLMSLGRFAAGSTSGDTCLNVSNNGQSSSILAFGTHSTSYPEIKYIDKVSVPMMTIDCYLDALAVSRYFFNFINLDIQGFELEALQGALRQLSFVDYVYCEVNIAPLYLGCPTLTDIDILLSHHGFQRVALELTGQGWGDAFYSRKNVAFLRLQLFTLLSLDKHIHRFKHRLLSLLLKVGSFLRGHDARL